MSKRLTKEEIVERARKVHGDKYDYSLFLSDDFKYERIGDDIPIICPIHGKFEQSAAHHLKGEGCQECAKIVRYEKLAKPFDEFVKEANKVHNGKYIYYPEKYKNNRMPIDIKCTVCGNVFPQDPMHHLRGEGCPECYKNRPPNNKMTVEKFEKMASIVHNGKYKYIGDFTETKKYVTFICPIHGAFKQEAQSHLQGHGCPRCGNQISRAEGEIYDYVSSLIGKENVFRRFKFDGKCEIDIYIRSLKIGIEYNGIIWHSTKFGKDNDYHLDKLNKCNENGIKLIQIFEDEWIEKKDIVLKKIKHILGFDNGEKIYARKCGVKEIDKHIAYDFLDKNHIQGRVNSTVFFGAFYNDKLVGVMGFNEESKDKWNLTRFATDNDVRCIGVAGKLFKAFLTAYNPTYVKSFADRRWTLSKEHNVYTELGFELAEILKPDYKYVNGKKREHKFGYRKAKLNKKYGVPLEWTEKQMTEYLGFYRIYDCGLLRYEWKRKEED
jgi:protein-arginine kinase activator protein McsA